MKPIILGAVAIAAVLTTSEFIPFYNSPASIYDTIPKSSPLLRKGPKGGSSHDTLQLQGARGIDNTVIVRDIPRQQPVKKQSKKQPEKQPEKKDPKKE